ncbi:MAG: ATP-binding protein, partial [Dehalococcoidia bacterium]
MDNDLEPDVPSRLIALRGRLGLSQQKLAGALGVSKLSIVRWENAKTRPSTALWQRVLRIELEGFAEPAIAGPGAAGSRTPPTNLPLVLTSFVGRAEELAAVGGLLTSQAARLLTLTGVGGCGKTRLALAAATSVTDGVRDGIWLIEFGGLTDPALVPQTVAAMLGVRGTSQRSLTETLAEFLRPRETILVLDNCEHLLAACATLATALLMAAPALRILATSRESLGVAGEQTWYVPPLALPDEDADQTRAASAVQIATDATRLFSERARLVDAGFTLDAGNGAAVVRICRRLDGLPLAIELAAARIALLSPAQIADRLDDRFRLLVGGSRSAPPRQQTLRAAVDWSYELLTAAEQLVFNRLSVFPSSFDLEAAEAVVGAPLDAPHAAIAFDIVGRLVAQSLVTVERHGNVTRYRLLETLREYGRERLRAGDDAAAEATLEAHAGYFSTLTAAQEAELECGRQPLAHQRLDREYDSNRAALGVRADRERWDADL